MEKLYTFHEKKAKAVLKLFLLSFFFPAFAYGQNCQKLSESFGSSFPTNWTRNNTTEVFTTQNCAGSNGYSLQLDGLDDVYAETPTIDMSSCALVEVKYKYREGDNTNCGNDPEGTDDVRVEYWDGSAWQQIAKYNGGPNQHTFKSESYTVSSNLTSSFKVRFYLEDGTGGNFDNWNFEDIEIIGVPNVPYKYDTSIINQYTADAFRGQSYARVTETEVTIAGVRSPDKVIERIYFSTTGSSNPSNDIVSARLFSQGETDLDNVAFDLTDTAGSPVSNPNGVFFVDINDKVQRGTFKYYLAYDISPNARTGNVVDATVDSIVISDTTYLPFAPNPSGNVEIIASPNYCNVGVNIPNTQLGTQIGLTKVEFGQVDNATGDDDQLTYYQTPVSKVYKQETYDVTLAGGQGNPEEVVGWVDWNNDGFFDPTTEEAFHVPNMAPATEASTSFTVPCDATIGTHRLRIATDFAGLAKSTPCDNVTYGEWEEYDIEVVQTPAVVAAVNAADSGFVNSPVEFTNNSTVRGDYRFEWDFGNNGTVDAISRDTIFTFPNSGPNPFKLKVILNGCNGVVMDSIIDTVEIITPTTPPNTEFISTTNFGNTNTPITLFDLSGNGPVTWEWKIEPTAINGNPTFTPISTSNTVQDYEVIFNETGKYTITLITSNSQGVDSLVKKEYISILPSINLCGITNTTTNDRGFLYDDGGPDAPYGSGNTCTFLINPKCADSIELDVSQFDVSIFQTGAGPTGDRLKVWDGTDRNGVALHTAAGYPDGFQNNDPSNVPITVGKLMAKSGAMFIEFTSDGAFVGEGFAAEWRSYNFSTKPPKAGISVTDSTFIGTPVTFTSLSEGYLNDLSWQIDNDNFIDSRDSVFTTSYASAGTYVIEHIAQNCGGVDTAYDTIVVETPTTAPVIDFEANYLRVTPDDVVSFTDLSDEGPTTWEWKVDPDDVLFMNGTDELNQNPDMRFTQTGTFDVKLIAENIIGKDSLEKQAYITVYDYCTPTVVNLNPDIGISRFTLTKANGEVLIDNQSATGQSEYTEYLNPTAQLEKGGEYIIRIERNTTYNAMNRAVWIDYNQDGDFTNNEQLLYENDTINKAFIDTFTLRTSSINEGLTRMRVSTNIANRKNLGCGPHFTGEFEDYSLNITPDQTKPIITILGPNPATVEEGYTYVDSGAMAMDNVDGNITNLIITNNNVDVNVPGTYTVTYDVTDAAGNEAETVIREVIVTPDATDPIIALTPPDTLLWGVNTPYVDPGYSATDNIDGAFATSAVNVSTNLNINRVGDYVITYQVSDSEGNTATEIRLVQVRDTTNPNLSLVGMDTVFVEVFESYTEDGANVSDNYDNNISYSINGNVNSNVIGTYPLTYEATDSSGNSAMPLSRIVIVRDTVSPVLTLFGNANLELPVFSSYIEPGYDVTDNYNNRRELTVIVNGTVDNTTLGEYTLQYTVEDESGNVSAVEERTIEVVDQTAPEIRLAGPTLVNIVRWEDYEDSGYVVSDNYFDESELTIEENENGSFESTLESGLYTYTYTAIDPEGNRSETVTRLINVEENTTSISENDGLRLEVYPNPIIDQFKLEFELESIKDVDISLWNSVGQQVKQITNDRTKVGKHEVDVSDLTSGTYILRVVVDNKTLNRQLVITK